MNRRLNFEHALLPEGWASNVVVEFDPQGMVIDVQSDAEISSFDARIAIPGMVNVHSHAHQRAMAGLAEQADNKADNFWGWRERMYGYLAAMQPQDFQAVAAQLYVEMLKAGYVHVAEFQYLHHQANGSPYVQREEMTLRALDAAEEAGIGCTALPVLYQYSGFGEQQLEPRQRRFANSPDAYLRLLSAVAQHTSSNHDQHIGVAAHSLRAVSRVGLHEVLSGLPDSVPDQQNKPPQSIPPLSIPIHIHIAEQQQEVADCVSYYGARPIEFCLAEFPVDEHWCLVHATHCSTQERADIIARAATVGLCPTTEANLGDGIFPALEYLEAGGDIAIGSDSNVSVSVTEELRWLEYTQRLRFQQRNLLGRRRGQQQTASAKHRSTAEALFNQACLGGAKAAGMPLGKIAKGYRASFVGLDAENPALIERAPENLLSCWIFAANTPAVQQVWVGGVQVISDGRHAAENTIYDRYRAAIKKLHFKL